MTTSSSYNFPWELIGSSFSGELNNEEQLQLQQWLDSDPVHKEKYEKLRAVWNNGLEDYKAYLSANEAKAWSALKNKLKTDETRTIHLKPNRTRKLLYQIAAVAAIFLIVFGIGYWFVTSRSTKVYETALNEKRNVNLTDGTAIALNPATRIEVAKGYNEKNRTVIMTSGEASFNVQHKTELPFVVDLGKVNVKDVGTVFTIKKDKELIKVTVISGSVAFARLSAIETRELTAGMSLTYNIITDSFSEIQIEKPVLQRNNILLNFDKTPLKDAIELIQKKFAKTIQLKGDSIASRKFTAHLDGLSYDTSLEIICKSLNLGYTVKDSIYVLYEKANK